MSIVILPLIVSLGMSALPLGAGDFERCVEVGDAARSYLVHVPPSYDSRKPTPVVLNFHGAWTDAAIQVRFSGLNVKADQAGFVVVYPNGTGSGRMRFWNSGMIRFRTENSRIDDVAFAAKLLDDLGRVLTIDPHRVYATGMSNGGMMCYRLAAELSDRIAAIAPVGGTMSIDRAAPKRPVPVLHFHGTADTMVPFNGPEDKVQKFLNFQSVDASIRTWVKLDGCPEEPQVRRLPDLAHDGTTVVRKTYGPGREQSEVVLIVIENGGHTWPGQEPAVKFLGKSTKQISANDLIWEFFQKHPMR